jgi:hypothetical protein
MFRVVVLYDEEADPDAFEQHADVCRRVANGVFRHGKMFGAPMGEPAHRYYAEWEFADRSAFDAAVKSDEFMATGRDLRDRGLPRPIVEYLELE